MSAIVSKSLSVPLRSRLLAWAFVRRLLQLSLIYLLLAPSAHAQTADVLGYQLRSLNNPSTESLAQYRGKTSVLMFFEPECPFCFKQAKILNQIQTECADFQAIGIGVNGNRQDLLDELRHLELTFPAYQINAALQADVGKVEGTPMMIVANKLGQYHTHSYGYQQWETLLPMLLDAGLHCDPATTTPTQ